MKVKVKKLARFGSWPLLCAGIDVANTTSEKRNGTRSRKKLIKSRSILTCDDLNAKSVKNTQRSSSSDRETWNYLEDEPNHELKDIILEPIVVVGKNQENENFSSKSLENFQNFEKNGENFQRNGCEPLEFNEKFDKIFQFSGNKNEKETIVTSEKLPYRRRSFALLDILIADDVQNCLVHSEALNGASLARSKSCVGDLEISKLELNPCNVSESPQFLSVIEEKEEVETHRSLKEDSSKKIQVCKNQNTNTTEVVVPRAKKPLKTRTPSLYVPSITPRLPLMGLLPGSVRRPSIETKEKEKSTKEKNKRSFFAPRNKSKERKCHSWIKVACSNSDVCEMCTRGLANTDVYQCNECMTTVHSHCKEPAEKINCNKIKHPKAAKLTLNHPSMSFPKKPENLGLGRFNSMKEPFVNSRGEEFRRDSSGILFDSDANKGDYPHGFFAATKPSSCWNDLNLWQEEPEAWSNSLGKNDKKKLTSKEIKRQDIIHELYVTEKHHCQILVVLKHTYFDAIAMHKILPVNELNRLLPRLDDLLKIHCNFLQLLKQRKDAATIVGDLSDVLLAQFTGEISVAMIDAYTKFCSQKDYTDRTFQELFQTNVAYQNFIKNLSSPFYKSRSLCDCLLLITQRLSKYHSFVENLRKNTVDDSTDKDGIFLAEKAVKELITAVDAGIDKIEMERFRMQVVKEMDVKSVTPFDKSLFTPKDLMSDERSLIYYANVQWPNAKRHPADVILLLFTDVLVFVQQCHNGQYNFFSQDGKAGVVSVRKMIVRDKAAKFGSDGVYLIATYPKPEMYEVRCKTKKDNVALINRIQKTVEQCPLKVTVVQEVVPSSSSTSLLNGKELEELRVLFDKLPEASKKLKLYFDDILTSYEDITTFINKLAPKIKNNEDKEKVASIVNTCMDSYLNTIQPAALAANLCNGAAKNRIEQQMSRLYVDENSASSENVVLRSNTFHGRVGHSIRRTKGGLRKHPTISGITEIDARTSYPNIKTDDSSCESISEEGGDQNEDNSERRPSNDVMFSVLKHLADTKIELTKFRETNARLECELAMAREQNHQRAKQTAVDDNNYYKLEELRSLHASLDKKKVDYMKFVEDKQMQFNKRDKILDEREAELSRRDKELSEKWQALYRVWEDQRLNGLPVIPLTSGVVATNSTNGELRRSYSVLSPGSLNQASPQQRPIGNVGKEVIPDHLQGSLVHGRYADQAPKTVIPDKLRKDHSISESLSSRFNLGRNSMRKKWGSTSKLPKDESSSANNNNQQQMIPNKLASGSNSKKK